MVGAMPLPSKAQDVGSAKRQMIQQSIQRYPGIAPLASQCAFFNLRQGSGWRRNNNNNPNLTLPIQAHTIRTRGANYPHVVRTREGPK